MASSDRRQGKEVLNRNFVTLVLLSIVAFIIGILGNYGSGQKVVFIFVSLILLLLAVVIQYHHSRKMRKRRK
jgi:NADH:ubiquinone oxidoreductase subunit K